MEGSVNSTGWFSVIISRRSPDSNAGGELTRVEELRQYGKDLLTIGEGSGIPFRTKLRLLTPVLRYLGATVRILGLSGTLELVRQVKNEIQRAEGYDWSNLKARGVSDEHLAAILKKIAVAKVMADTMGIERATQVRQGLSHSMSVLVFEEMFAPAEVFVQCGEGDFLPGFKTYYVAMMEAMANRGLEQAEVVIGEEDEFQLNVTYCAWAEVARALGDPYYCYYSTCYGDEVFFPHLCEQAGFEFQRQGTLAQGAPVCDFGFTRKGQAATRRWMERPGGGQ
jgi:hypothetical protein